MKQENTSAPVFLSYAHKNLPIAIRLEQDLWEKKIPVWRDERDMKPGDDWDQKIRDAIASSCAVIYLATPDARASRVVRAELALASMYEKPVYLLWREGKAWVDVVPLDYYPDQHIDIREHVYQDGLHRLFIYLEQLTFAADQPYTPDDPGKDSNMSTPGSPLQKPSVTIPLMARPPLLKRIFKRKHVTDNELEQKVRRLPQKRNTAYDWQCLDQHNAPIGIAITDACQWHYNRIDAFDRLVNYSSPDGWECWAPKAP